MGTLWPKSGFVERDDNDVRAGGALAYFFVGGTTTPLPVYEDAGEDTPHTHPVVADANGRWEAVFIPFTTSYDIQVTTAGGTQLYYYEEIPNPDPVEASEDSVDATELSQTGDFKWRPVNTTLSGWVRANGRTIGSATSGATERANADCEDLFLFLWNNLANGQAAVSSGRGASAAADFAANKTIAVPDLRCSTPMGVADMGSSTATGYASAPFAHGAATTAGSLVGANLHTLTTAQLPNITPAGSVTGITATGSIAFPSASVNAAYTPAGTVPITDLGHNHDNIRYNQQVTVQSGAGATGIWQNDQTVNSGSDTTGITASFTGTPANAVFNQNVLTANFTGNTVSGTFTGTPFGSGTAHNNVSFGLLGTWFCKL